MTARPRHPKPDANQSQVHDDLKASGFPHIWLDVSSLPVKLAGVDVYVIGWSQCHGRVECLPVEVKMEGEKLNRNEREFFDSVEALGYLGVDIPIIARRAEDILDWFGWV